MKQQSLVVSSSFFFASGPSHSAPTRPPCGDGAVCVCVLCLCWVFPAQIQYFCSPVRQLFFASRPWSCGLVACFLSAFEAFWFRGLFPPFLSLVLGFNKPSRDLPLSCRYAWRTTTPCSSRGRRLSAERFPVARGASHRAECDGPLAREKARRNDSTPSFHPATGEADTSISQHMRIFQKSMKISPPNPSPQRAS